MGLFTFLILVFGGFLLFGVLSFIRLRQHRQRSFGGVTPDAQIDRAFLDEAELYAINYRLVMVAGMAKLAKLDGVVTKNELAVVETFFGYLNMVGEERRLAIDLFQHAKTGKMTVCDCALLFQRMHHHEPGPLLLFILMLFRVAHADGLPETVTARALVDVCGATGMDYAKCVAAYEQSRKNSELGVVGEAYTVLGCQPNDPPGIIKDRYRKLVKDFHPDTVIAKGLSDEFVKFAEDRFKQIQAAYETVMQARGAERA